jgi:hypothetical protein
MAILGFVLASFLDPIQAGIVLVVLLVHRGALPVIVAALCATLVCETAMALAAADYVWGELLAPRMVSALLQAAVLWWAVRWLRSFRRGSAAPAGSGGAAGNASAGFGRMGGGRALPPASAAPRE